MPATDRKISFQPCTKENTALSMKLSKILLPFWITVATCVAAEEEFNAVMMWNTFEIQSPIGEPIGTGFLIAKPVQPTGKRYKVLVTADHVFSSNAHDIVIVVGRERTGSGDWKIRKTSLKIRDGTTKVWEKSPDADVAAIYCSVPDPPILIGFELLANDDFLTQHEIHPGDSVFILGYPLGLAGNHGFPILRPGVISSYPLIPTSRYPVFNIAFTVFPGNSGSPVYIVDHNRTKGGSTAVGLTIHGILGVVIRGKQNLQIQETKRQGLSEETFEKRVLKTPLDVADVVQASVVRRLVESLPNP